MLGKFLILSNGETFECVREICDKKELYKVSVKVHHKWNVVTNKKFEIIFYDKEVAHKLEYEYICGIHSSSNTTNWKH